MRAFLALVPPVHIVEDLAGFLESRREDRGAGAGAKATRPGLRWTRDEHLHITLAFFPDLADRDLDEVSGSVEAACGRLSCGPVRFAGAGAFPDVSAARVLWQGVEPGDDVRRLAEALRTAAARAGTTVDAGASRPHLTVARLSRPRDATRYLRVLEAYTGPSWQPEDVVLIRSYLGQGPHRTPRYEIVETFGLANGFRSAHRR